MLKEDTSKFSLMEEMIKDHLAGPDIYRASVFWTKLNQLNTEWLRQDGLENFKRTVNNNYFNWMVSVKSVYFRNVAKNFFRTLIRSPKGLISLFTVSIGDMYHRTYASSDTHFGYLQKKIYTLYVLFLYEFVKQRDQYKLFANLEEPDIGNPICIKVNGKRVSQDISNSYMEYSYIRSSLGDDFPKLKVIAEIGGGYGRLSYLFHLFHQQDRLKIVMVDLPPALFIAQWYMRTAFPGAKIMTYRHFSDFSEIEESFKESSICFLLPHQLEMLPEGLLDLVINVSSLHEMSRPQINHYYSLIDHKAKFFYTKQWVLWENPDDKITVPAVIYPTRPTWGLISARINPVHAEFFEAMFRIQ